MSSQVWGHYRQFWASDRQWLALQPLSLFKTCLLHYCIEFLQDIHVALPGWDYFSCKNSTIQSHQRMQCVAFLHHNNCYRKPRSILPRQLAKLLNFFNMYVSDCLGTVSECSQRHKVKVLFILICRPQPRFTAKSGEFSKDPTQEWQDPCYMKQENAWTSDWEALGQFANQLTFFQVPLLQTAFTWSVHRYAVDPNKPIITACKPIYPLFPFILSCCISSQLLQGIMKPAF